MTSEDYESLLHPTANDKFLGFPTFFGKLYDKKISIDVEFDLLGPEGPITISGHKLVFSIWSPYFADKLYPEGSDTGNTVTLQYNDVNPETFEAMIKFMYGDSKIINRLQNHKKACDLYKLADRFMVANLMESCRQFVNGIKIEPSNVFDILDASVFMQNRSRIDVCLNMIEENTEEVMRAFDFSGISTSMLHTFLDLPRMSLPGEYDLIAWVFAWGKNKYVDTPDLESVREALQPFLPKMNFLALSNVEFAEICKMQEKVFTNNEIISIFMNIGVRGSMTMPEWYDDRRPSRVYKKMSYAECAAKASEENTKVKMPDA